MVGKRASLLVPAPRQFKQRRAAATYEALLQAAAAVFARRGFDAAQTPEIAAEAGVSTGAFYRYFTDKRHIFIEVMREHLVRAHNDVMQRLTPELFVGSDVRGAIDRVLDVLFEHIARGAPLERELVAMSLRDREAEQLRAEFEEMGLATLSALIAQIVPKERVPHARAAAIVVQVAALELAVERAGLRPRLGPTVPDAEVKRALREMLFSYLFAPAATPPPAARARPRRRRPAR
jgi:AcrR family transcriptional regulator